MTMKLKDMKLVEVIELVSSCKFGPFDEHDWHCFSGVEDKNPVISRRDDLVIVIDGDILTIFHNDYDLHDDQIIMKYENIG